MRGVQARTGPGRMAVARFAVVLIACGCACRLSADTGRAEVIYALLDHMKDARIGAGVVELRPSAPAGGVLARALFEHPAAPGKPGRVDFAVTLPSVAPGEALVLAFGYAISDGVPWAKEPEADGVQFSLKVDGERLFCQDWRESRWQPGGADLTRFAGRRVTLSLATDARRNPRYDWALWGNPRILRIRPASAGAAAGAPCGIVSFAYRPGASLSVKVTPDSGDPPLEWHEPPTTPGGAANPSVVLDYSFARADGVRVEAGDPGAITAEGIRLAGYRPRLIIERVSAAQALPSAGADIGLRITVRNQGPGTVAAGAATAAMRAAGAALGIHRAPRMAPGDVWRTEWTWRAPGHAARLPIVGSLSAPDQAVAQNSVVIETFRISPVPPSAVLANDAVRLEFISAAGGCAAVIVKARAGGAWNQVGVLKPLFRATLPGPKGPIDREIRPRSLSLRWTKRGGVADLEGRTRDRSGADWVMRLRIALDPVRPIAHLAYEWRPTRATHVAALWGPSLYAGDGAFADAKLWGLFPGLEYLYKGEPSSNRRGFAPPLHDRRTPMPWKVTVPVMAVTTGPGEAAASDNPGPFWSPDSLKDMAVSGSPAPVVLSGATLTVGLAWDPLQKWDGIHAYPSARYASPNYEEGMRNHHMALFVPSVPDYVPENGDRAVHPVAASADRPLRLTAELFVRPGPATVAVRTWLDEHGGLPTPPRRPRSFEEAMALCRAGFMQTVWNPRTHKWRACMEVDEAHIPGIAALLWLDAHTARDASVRAASRARVDEAVGAMLGDVGPGVLASRESCHIMRWQLPFLYGYLPEAMDGLEVEIRGLVASWEAGGGRFAGSDPQHASLGAKGDAVCGSASHEAYMLMRHARVTGDSAALSAGKKALAFLERFRVPRGAGPWECPIYEPDVLAAAWNVAACTEGYRATGDRRWLHDAVYWAESGLPFVYLWSLPDRPTMLGSMIPTFGTTFYTHSWIGVPVQWEGLVYGYYIQQLAAELDHAPSVGPNRPGDGSPLPLGVGLSPAEWRRLAELLTVSGLRQQIATGERLGTYPDSIADFSRPNPPFINPEDSVVNLLALAGSDPDIQTRRVDFGGRAAVVSSGARIEGLSATGGGLRMRLRFYSGENSHTLLSGIEPTAVRASGQVLPRSSMPVRRAPGWWWDAARHRLYVVAPHMTEWTDITVDGLPTR